MKLGVSYIVFDGVELLEHSIRQIRQHVEYISVIYQKVSWFGKTLPTEDFNVLKTLLKTGQINELIEFTSFLPLNSKERSAIPTAKRYETAKRQVGLNLCLRNRCTHYLCMDVDEFYDSSQFSKAKEQIIKYNYDVTAVRFINYVNIPTLHRGYDSIRVPFICKISNSSKMSNKFFVKCDPTRGISGNTTKSHEFSSTDLTMHHMETVRKNLLLKYESTTRGIMDRGRTRELVKIIGEITEHCTTFNFKKIIFPKAGNGNLTKCENIFNIPYAQWKKQ
jgi:hypothetical protein